MKLKELADEQESNTFQQRAGRLAKWRELAEQAAADRKSPVKIPSGLENLGIPWHCFIFPSLASFFMVHQCPPNLQFGILIWDILGFSFSGNYQELRSGNIVLALVPKLSKTVAKPGLVLSVWTTTRKPKLATTTVSFEHTVAVRIAVLERKSFGGDHRWICSNESPVWVLRPQSIVAVLDHTNFEDETEGCSLSLTEKSLALVEESASIPEWWPLLSEDSDSQRPVKHAGLFVQRQGRKRKNGDKAEGTKKVNLKAASKKLKAKLKKTKKKKTKDDETEKNTEKEKNTDKEKTQTAENTKFNRTPAGEKAIKVHMMKLKALDDSKFPGNTLFNADGLCRLKVGKCKAVPWDSFLESAFKYFKIVCLAEFDIADLGGSVFFLLV